jgi:hypothetical protein
MPMPRRKTTTRRCLAPLLAGLMMGASGAQAGWELSGLKTLTLHTRDDQALVLGAVNFQPRADGRTGFTLALDHARFKDFFLSMKEFKCLEGQGEILCHVPYPYAQPGTVSATDMAWLEHALLFLFKQPSEFGAKLWNGLYFQMRLTEQGIVGTPQAIDLNAISAPPDDLNKPPYRPALRDDIAPGARWATRLTIE